MRKFYLLSIIALSSSRLMDWIDDGSYTFACLLLTLALIAALLDNILNELKKHK